MKKLYLDDVRLIPDGYLEVRSYAEVVLYVPACGFPVFLSFDHDLGLEESGHDCAKWLVNYCLDNDLRLPEFAVHSQNPVRKENIASLLNNFNNKSFATKITDRNIRYI